MGVYRIHRSIDVSFAHHVRGHRGACINLHGHTWKFEVGLAARQLDAQGFVVDFGDLSQQVLKPCHALLDHALAVGEATYADVAGELEPLGVKLLKSREVVHGADAETPSWAPSATPSRPLGGAELRYPGGLKVCVFPFSPTSERLAQWLYEVADAALSAPDRRAWVDFARVYETLHPVESVAEYRPD